MMTRCLSTYRSYFSRLLSKRDRQDFIEKKMPHVYMVEGLNVINYPKCNKVLNVITFCPKCNKALNVIKP